MQSAAAHKLLDRGVWLAPYLFDDREQLPVLIAVDRRGVVRKHVKLRAGVDEQRATDWLWQVLDRIDPIQLRLVEPSPTRTRREVDPRLYEDPRSPLARRRYVARLTAAAAAKLPRRPSDI